jgi:hypothetical protein
MRVLHLESAVDALCGVRGRVGTLRFAHPTLYCCIWRTWLMPCAVCGAVWARCALPTLPVTSVVVIPSSALRGEPVRTRACREPLK